MKLFKDLRKFYIIPVVVALSATLFIGAVQAVTNDPPEPGSDADPLVSKNYVDSKINGLNAGILRLTQENASLKTENEKMKQEIEKLKGSSKFVIITLDAGKQLFAGDGAEIILRGGQASGIKGESGGLADVVTGNDIATGASVPPNHILISSADDGRGLKSLGKVWLLVRGTYTIK